MATIPLPALDVKPPQQPDPMSAYGNLLRLKMLAGQGALQQQQLVGAQQENQIRAAQLQDQQTIQSIAPKYIKNNSDGSVGYDFDGLEQGAIAAGVRPQSLAALQTMRKNAADTLVASANAKKIDLENINTLHDQARGMLEAFRSADDPQAKQAALSNALQFMQKNGMDTSRIPQDPNQITPQMLDGFEANLAMGSQLAKEASERTQANARLLGAQTGKERLDLERPGILADNTTKQANAAVAPQLANLNVQGKQTEIAKNQAETAAAYASAGKSKVETANLADQPIFAVDPTTNERVMTTRTEAAQRGYTNPVSVKEGDVSKETDARAMINDVQLNKSRYQMAMQRVYSEPMTTAQKTALVALTPEKLGMDFGKLFSLNMPDVLQKVTNATAFSTLSPAQKQAVVGYYSTLASVPAAQKALTNIGRSNKEMLDLELRTIPTPLMDQGSFSTMLDRFQGNIDQTARKTVRMPGMPSTQDIRRTYEPQQQPRRTSPAQFMDVPSILRPSILQPDSTEVPSILEPTGPTAPR